MIKIEHTATVSIPYGSNLGSLVDLVRDLKDLPEYATFAIRQETGSGGETTITVHWEENRA